VTGIPSYFWPIRIYYEDTDSGGVVYHSNYLNFLERARTEWLRNLGIEQDELKQKDGVIFAVRKVEIDYKLAARFNDLLMTTTTVTKVSGASIELNQTIRKDEGADMQNSVIICDATIKIVSLQVNGFKPCAIPEILKTRL